MRHPSGAGSGSRAAAIPYLLLAPGLLWLAIFFLAPLYFMARQSLESGTLFTGYSFTWEFSNYTNAISNFHEQLIRSFEYAAASTILALLIGYPLAYAIASRGGKWRTALILLVILPSSTRTWCGRSRGRRSSTTRLDARHHAARSGWWASTATCSPRRAP